MGIQHQQVLSIHPRVLLIERGDIKLQRRTAVRPEIPELQTDQPAHRLQHPCPPKSRRIRTSVNQASVVSMPSWELFEQQIQV
jgi:hypothetical protein